MKQLQTIIGNLDNSNTICGKNHLPSEIVSFDSEKGTEIMPISECYKIQTIEKGSHIFTVNAINSQGLKLTNKITKKVFNYLSCRSVDYKQAC